MVEFVNPMQEHFAPWVQKVLDGAFAVLERKGLLVPQPQVLRTLAGATGVSVNDSRVFFAPSRSSGFLDRYRKCHAFSAQPEFALGTGAHAHHIVDVDGTLRPIVLADVEAGTRLEAALELEDSGVRASAPGIPQDVPPPLQALAQLLAAATNKPGYPTHVPSTAPEAEGYIIDCLDVLGYSQSVGVHMVSPLRFEGDEVERALRIVRATPGSSVGVGTMPVLGVSAPASVLGGFVVATAEVLGGAMVFEALGTAVTDLGLSVNAYPFDMRYGSFIYGAPANVVCTLLEREINRMLGAEVPAKSFNTTAQRPGPQACAQKAAFTGLMAGLGKKLFSGGASLSVDEIYSPVQLIYDREILGYIRCTAQILASSFGEGMLMVDEIIRRGSDYMAAESTVSSFRALQWDSGVFPSRMLAQWQAAGCPLEEQAAVKEIKRLLDGYEYHLPEDKARALDGIYVRAARNLT
jgi:trimethylamine:corrinoid methyltransferase-like protein